MLLEVADTSQVSAARRAATQLAQARGFDETKVGRVALIATELATNLLKHAERGEIVVDTFADASGSGLELIALDRADGIADLGHALRDGTSTAGTPGTGLGAIRRQADQLNIFTRPQRGTAIAARILDADLRPLKGGVELGAVAAPYPGETVSGDAWSFAATPHGPTLFLADGSGHGLLAHKAALAALSVFQDGAGGDPVTLVQDMHRALAPTRGAAVALARFDVAARVVRFVGVGNIVGAVVAPDAQVRRMVSHNGTVGHVASRITEFSYPCPPGSLIVLHSDGLSAKWDLQPYAGLAAAHPSMIAGVLFRDFRRKHDDATIAVMRVPR